MNIFLAILTLIVYMFFYIWYTEWLIPKLPLCLKNITHINDNNWWASLLFVILFPVIMFGWLILLYFIIEKPF